MMKIHAIKLLVSLYIILPTFASDRREDVETKFNQSMKHFKEHENDRLEISNDMIKLLLSCIDGDAEAQSLLGDRYQVGYGVKQDFLMARHYHQLAADLGHAHSQYNLGTIYFKGLAGIQDYTLALDLYQKAALQGYKHAQNNLGVMYRDGNGVKQDYAMALKYFQLAADQGYEDSQFSLGAMHWNGQGVDRNRDIALKYFTLAAQKGSKLAQETLKKMQLVSHQDEILKKTEPKKAENTYRSNSENLHTRSNAPLPASTKKTKTKNTHSHINKKPPKEKSLDEIKLKTPKIDKNNTMESIIVSIDSPTVVVEEKKSVIPYKTENMPLSLSPVMESQEEASKDKKPSLLSRAKNLTIRTSKGKITHVPLEDAENIDHSKDQECTLSHNDDKSEEKSTKSKKTERSPKTAHKKLRRMKVYEGSKSMSISINNNSSFSQSEQSCVSISEKSEIEESMAEGEFEALVKVLRDRDIKSVSQVQLTQNTILNTLLGLEKMNLIEIKRSRKRDKIRATLLGPYFKSRRPSLTIHMHDHDKPWHQQSRVKNNFLNLIEACGLDIKTILHGGDSAGYDADENGSDESKDIHKT